MLLSTVLLSFYLFEKKLLIGVTRWYHLILLWTTQLSLDYVYALLIFAWQDSQARQCCGRGVVAPIWTRS